VYAVDGNAGKEGRCAGLIEHRDGVADSRWVQEVTVKPGTEYTFAGWIRTEDVTRHGAGAFLVVENTTFKTEEIFGTADWQHVEVTARTEAGQERLKVQCRLGNYGAPNTGRAWFDGITFREAP
jgi:hypothetical protein